MFERYTQDARRTLFFARAKTLERNGDEITPEDLLDGILLAAPELVRRFAKAENDGLRWEKLLQSPESADAWMQRQFADGDPRITRETPFGHQVKMILITAAEEADALDHRDIEPVHLLLGLLHDENTEAWQKLHDSGVALHALREALRQQR